MSRGIALAGRLLLASLAGDDRRPVGWLSRLAALVLLGVGWNFMFIGGTTLLTESYAPPEKARTQGANDFLVFATMGVSSLASGAMVSMAGWETMNRAMLPFLAAIAGVVLWFAWRRRAVRPAHA